MTKKKKGHLTKRQALVYGAYLLPMNVFFKLYLADQEKAARISNMQKRHGKSSR